MHDGIVKVVFRFSSTRLMHRVGVSHRGLNPNNVLVTMCAVVKICDFGCAALDVEGNPGRQHHCHRHHPRGSKCIEISGRLWYQAPERFAASDDCCCVGGPLDMWSLGCILGELFQGKAILPVSHSLPIYLPRLARISANLPQ